MKNPLRIAPRLSSDVQAAYAGVPAYGAGDRDPGTYPIATPWGSSDLERWAFADALGLDAASVPVGRAAAMRLPAIARGRNMIVSSIAGLPLVDPATTTAPTWLYTTGDGSSPQLRTAYTVDDLIFHGWSCWWRDNDATGRYPLKASRIDYDDWEIDPDNFVRVNGEQVGASDVIVIPGFHEGILNYGGDVIRDATSLYEMVRKRLANPVPELNLNQTDGVPLTDTQIDALIDRWAVARKGGNGGVGFTSIGLELQELGAGGEALMVDARNAAAVDLARLVGVHAGMVDATAPKASLNYETQTGRNQEFVDFDLALYMAPITARLSLDDVTAHGRRVAFDTTNLTGPTPSPTGPTIED